MADPIVFDPNRGYVPSQFRNDLVTIASLDGNDQDISTEDILAITQPQSCFVGFNNADLGWTLCAPIAAGMTPLASAEQKLNTIRLLLTPPRHTGAPGLVNPNNPIRTVIQIESMDQSGSRSMILEEDTLLAYQFLYDVNQAVDQRLAGQQDPSPKDKLTAIYGAILDQGVTQINHPDSSLLVDSIRERHFSHQSLSLVVWAVARERGWPISLVETPDHTFVRWDDGTQRVNVDYKGNAIDAARLFSMTDAQYQAEYPHRTEAFANGVYLAPLNEAQIAARAYENRAKKIIDQQGDLGPTFDLLKQAILLDHRSPTLYVTMAYAANTLGHTSTASLGLEAALDLDPGYTEARYQLAKIYVANSQRDPSMASLAITLLRRVMTEAPDLAEAYYTRGLAYVALRRLDQALADFDHILDHSDFKADPLLHFNRSACLHELGRYAEAIAGYKKVLELDPRCQLTEGDGCYQVYFNLAMSLSKNGQLEEALETIDRAIVEHPDKLSVYPMKVALLAQLDRYDEARALLMIGERTGLGRDFFASQLPADHPFWDYDTHMTLAETYAQHARYDEALLELRKIIKTYPKQIAPEKRLVSVYLDKGDSQAALKALTAQSRDKRYVRDITIPLLRSPLLLEAGRKQEALRSCERALAIDSNNLTARLNMARVLDAQARHQETLPHLDFILDRRPGLQEARLLRAHVLVALGRHDEARYDLEIIRTQTDPGRLLNDLLRPLLPGGNSIPPPAKHEKLPGQGI